MSFSIKNLGLILVAMLTIAVGNLSAAGLVGYRNDTAAPVVVRSTVIANGIARTSKPQTLYPGESALDSLAFAGQRTVVVYDAKKPSQILFNGVVNSVDDVFFSIQPKTATLKVRSDPPPPPAVELIKTQPPAMPRPGRPMNDRPKK